MSTRHRVAGGIKVRGHCADGHLTEATTDAGRTTWEGPCAHDGCELKVKATRRTPAAATSEPPATAAPPPDTRQRRLREVDYERSPRKRDQPANPATDGTGGKPDTAAAQPPAGAAAVHRDTPDPAARGGRAADAGPPARSARASERIRERITGRRQARESRQAVREFRLPY